MTDKQRDVLSDLPKLFEGRINIEPDSVEMRVAVPDDPTMRGLEVTAIWHYTTEEAQRRFPEPLPSEFQDFPLAGTAAWTIGYDGSVANLHGEQQELWPPEGG